MSYILEALKRSQEERELGTVPTLSSAPNPQSQGPHGRGNPWVLTALLLAALAIAVASYALLNQGKAPLAQNEGSVTPLPDRTGESAPILPGQSKAAERDSTPLQESVIPSHPPAVASTRPVPPQEGRLEGLHRQQGSSLSSPIPDRKPSLPHDPSPALSPGEGKPTPASKTERIVKPSQTRSAGPALSPPTAQRQDKDFQSVIQPLVEEASTVPPDLQEEIEAFKQRIEEERKTPTPETAATETTQPPPVPAQDDSKEPGLEPIPGLWALPSSVQTRIPPHRISVHVYSADPAKRFVILNARRMKEGDSNGEGLRLEQIRPDGVVLRYGKHRFFSER